jgi:protein-disulfide isomerase
VKVGADWNTIGDAENPVTIVEFTDLQCAFCRRFHSETFPTLKKELIDTGKVRFVSRDFPLQFHEYAFKAAEEARCAGEQGRFWVLRDAMLGSLGALSRESVLSLATNLHLDSTALRECLDKDTYKAAVLKDMDEAMQLEIDGTPTFIVAKTSNGVLRGIRMVGAQSYPDLKKTVDKLIASSPPTQ